MRFVLTVVTKEIFATLCPQLSFFSLVDHHVRLGDADELRHRLLHVEVLDFVPLLRRLRIHQRQGESWLEPFSSYSEQTDRKRLDLLDSARARGSSLQSVDSSSAPPLSQWLRGCRGQCWRSGCIYKQHTTLVSLVPKLLTIKSQQHSLGRGDSDLKHLVHQIGLLETILRRQPQAADVVSILRQHFQISVMKEHVLLTPRCAWSEWRASPRSTCEITSS